MLPHIVPNKEHAASIGTVVRQAPKVGRNGACPCGSGKKYKMCCIGRT